MKNNILKIRNCKLKTCPSGRRVGDFRRGMTYVELIVVLSIFSIMSSVVIFNYGDFQAKIDVKNLAGDIALKIVEAQKSSLSGRLPPLSGQYPITNTWKPSFGLYFNRVSDNKSFIYFTDLDNTIPPQNGLFDGSDCASECLEKISITKENIVSNLDVFYQGGTSDSLGDLTITFKRPSGAAIIKSSSPFTDTVSYAEITVLSPKAISAKIKIYPSGRIQVD